MKHKFMIVIAALLVLWGTLELSPGMAWGSRGKDLAVATGDHSNTPLLVIVLIVSGLLLLIFGIIAYKRKK